MSKLRFISVTALIFVSTQLIAADIKQGQVKAATCIGCHGIDGNAVVPTFPKLAGQNAEYLLKQMQDFKSGARIDPIMAGIVAPLTQTDIENLAAFYAVQKLAKSSANVNADTALGESIYRGGKKEAGVTACIACHGPEGRGIPSAGFPVVSSQHAAYTIKQLKEFRQHSINAQTGNTKPSRTNDYEGVMINFTKSLTNAEIEAVAEYIASLY